MINDWPEHLTPVPSEINTHLNSATPLHIRGQRLVHVVCVNYYIYLFAQSTKRGDPVLGTNTPFPAPLAGSSGNLSAGEEVLTVILTVDSTQNLKNEKLEVSWLSLHHTTDYFFRMLVK